MKRCPECRRDYYDDSLLYCLDDGTALLDGPASASGEEPGTAILHEVSGPTGLPTAVLSPADTGSTRRGSIGSSVKWLVAAAVIVIALLGSYFAYRSYGGRRGEITSIAVLPFENKSEDPDTDYLSDGLGESLIFRLSQLPGLKVSPLSSVTHYKGAAMDVAKIAGELGVDSVMTGKMVKRGDNLSITVELVDVRNNASLWGERYERKMSDLLAIQREIATTITQKLQLKLAGNEKGLTKKYTDSNEAYQLYLNGRFHFARRTKEEVYKSIDLLERAVNIDPNFALAYSSLAEVYTVIPSFPYASPAECLPKAKAAVAKALELDPDLPEAHTVAGMIAATYDWDWATAEREFKRSLEIDPNLAITHYRYAWTYLSPIGRHDQAIAEMRKAMELEPLSLVQGANYAGVLIYARRYDEAAEQAKKTYDLDPSFGLVRNWLAHAYDFEGKYTDSLTIIVDAERSGSAFAYAKLGQTDKARAVIAHEEALEKTSYVLNYWIAVGHAAVGDKDAAFAELEKAYQNHDWFMQRIKVDPYMDSLRDDPRFDAMIKRLNFPQ